MTEREKDIIIKLHSQGRSYRQIAEELNLSVNTIKSFMARRKAKNKDCYCKQCNIPLVFTPGKKAKKFCSDKCRMKWWRENSDVMNRRTFKVNTCPICNKSFKVYSTKEQVYCSHPCYIKGRFGEQNG